VNLFDGHRIGSGTAPEHGFLAHPGSTVAVRSFKGSWVMLGLKNAFEHQ
jgi:hypothetical protein